MANRQYKDTVFRKFFNHKDKIAELYQAIRPNEDVRAEDITITTLDDVFIDQQKNDLSFLWKDQSVVLVEHQSSVNPNMPYRLLIYSALVQLPNFVDSKALYGTTLVKIPAPHFYVLYIGDDMDKDEETLKLSAAFKETGADLELVCHVLNITYKKERKILENCRSLWEYSFFVHRIDENKKSGMTLDDAIREAITYCIAHGIMKEFLETNREEVIKMFAFKWDAEEEKRVLCAESEARGEAKGKAEGVEESHAKDVRSLMETLQCTKEKAMELLKIPADLQPRILAMLS
ncbi:MAG: transposase [Selenomonadaceae bacterium]